jgi:citrate synthase
MTAAKVLQLNEKTATVTIENESLELPTIEGTEGERAIDISKLRSQTGYVTLDNGFVNTSPCTSAITFLDGENGILRYRGYPIEQLAEHSSFIEVSQLLFSGEIPSADASGKFERQIWEQTKLPDSLRNLIKSFPQDAHPMAMLAAGVVAMSANYPEFSKHDLDGEQKDQLHALLLGNLSQMAAFIYRHGSGKDWVESSSKDFCTNFLHMVFDGNTNPIDPDVSKALDTLLILHADHEQNCSTSTVRLIGSSQASPFAAVSGGIGALWGPLHGGANQAVLEMLQEIKSAGGDYKKFLEMAKDKNSGFRLMGFGHRVYKNFDPRAKIIKTACDNVLNKLGVNDPLLEIAKGLEEQALQDPYFVERKLYPNVDFYSGIIYRALGIPTNMFTVMFALGRLPGWLSQWKEMIENSQTKIGRPRQIYTGEPERDFKR